MNEPRQATLALEPDQFRALGHALVDQLAEFLASLPERPVRPPVTPAELKALLPQGALPSAGEDPGALLGATARLLFDHSTFNGHPRFFGYITSSPAHIGMLGDLLAAAINPNCGSWTLGPLATEIESQTLRWIAELIGYPATAGGVLVSGGNVANFTCFLAARARVADWDVRGSGLTAENAKRLVVYTSAETHTWVQKATDLFGLGTDAIRWIPCDRQQRMDAGALRAALEQDAARGLKPLMVIGTAGTVSTGAIDPLHGIADICAERHIWFHIDGAYGALAAAVPGGAPELDAISRADSIAVDPHKWLYTPLEAGAALVRDVSALHDAFSYHPAYYHFDGDVTNFVDRGLQNSRGFRALKVWLALRQAGRDGYARMIGEDIALAQRLHERVTVHRELEAVTCNLSICTFRYVPEDMRARTGDAGVEQHLDQLNRTLLDRLQHGGEAFVSNAVVEGRYVLRACVVNFNTRAADIDALPGIVARLGRTIDAELRPRAGGTQLDV
jgi:aromatic-L-amino-acid/L-tryptophan decarboxylase